jgi:hypothetical protein
MSYQHNPHYNYLVSLVRAFRDGAADFIVIDSRHKNFQIQAAEYGVSEGLLSFEELGSDEAQYTEWRYRLTPLGKQLILDPQSPNQYID